MAASWCTIKFIARDRALLLGLSILQFEFTELVLEGMPDQGRQVVDEELAQKMVALVLNRPAQQVVSLVLDQVPLQVISQHPDLASPTHVRIHPRKAQAAFLTLH